VQFEVGFQAKQEARFAEFVRKLAQANSDDVYVWTDASNSCGLLRPVPLLDLDLAFPFDWSPDGVLVLITADFADKLLLDFFEDDSGEPRLAVEVSGAHWGHVRY
jgi:hypothetical protein